MIKYSLTIFFVVLMAFGCSQDNNRTESSDLSVILVEIKDPKTFMAFKMEVERIVGANTVIAGYDIIGLHTSCERVAVIVPIKMAKHYIKMLNGSPHLTSLKNWQYSSIKD